MPFHEMRLIQYEIIHFHHQEERFIVLQTSDMSQQDGTRITVE